MHIRKATLSDTGSIIDVTTRSIRELCVIDHQNRPEVLDRWLRNKNGKTVRSWISSDEGILLVAIQEDVVVGVAMVNLAGYVSLCYIDPHCVGKGVGKALMNALEIQSLAHGLTMLKLESTQTAHEFYLKCGYNDTDEMTKVFDMPVFSMGKTINGQQGAQPEAFGAG